MPSFELSVIVVSYNTKSILYKCLTKIEIASSSYESKHKGKVETIIVDNNSSDGSVEMVKKSFPNVRLIRSDKNWGFGKANNLGMKKAKGSYLLLLNSDSFIDKNTIIKTMRKLRSDPELDVLTIKPTYKNGTFQPAGGYLPTPIRTIAWMMGFNSVGLFRKFIKPIHAEEESFYDKQVQLEWVGASFMLLKRKVFTETKGFDENIFMYSEDIEWCKRIKDAGFNIFFTPEIKFVHLEGSSDKKDIDKKLLDQIKGIVYYHKKFYPKSLVLVKFFLNFGLFIRFLYFSLINDRKSKAYKNAMFNF